MGLGHDGLRILLAKPVSKGGADIDVTKLNDGDLVMCLNGAGDKLKVIGHNGLVVGYLKMPRKERIMYDALQYIPQTFGGKGFDYNAACKRALDERLGKYAPKKTGPIETARAKQAAGL